MAITSQLRPAPMVGEVAVLRWQEAGLLKPSIIKPLVTTIETNLMLRQLGTLHAEDQDSLRKVLAAIIGCRGAGYFAGLSRSRRIVPVTVYLRSNGVFSSPGPMISVFGSQVSPRLMSSLRVGMPIAGCQVRVARTSGQMASPVTDSLYLSAMLAVGLLDRLPAAIVVGQRHRATSPLPTKMRNVGNSWHRGTKCPNSASYTFYFRS